MEYRRPVERTFQNTVHNPIGLVIVSIAASASLLPFISSVLLSVPFGWIAGLWTSSLLLGVILVGGFSLTGAVADRGVSLGTDYFWVGIRDDWKAGLVVGVCTFFVTFATAILVVNPLGGVARLSTNLFGFYLFLGWWTWMGFSLPVFATGVTLRVAFAQGGVLLLTKPVAGLWLIVQGIGLALLAAITIITPVVLLPGVLMLLSTQITKSVKQTELGRP